MKEMQSSKKTATKTNPELPLPVEGLKAVTKSTLFPTKRLSMKDLKLYSLPSDNCMYYTSCEDFPGWWIQSEQEDSSSKLIRARTINLDLATKVLHFSNLYNEAARNFPTKLLYIAFPNSIRSEAHLETAMTQQCF